MAAEEAERRFAAIQGEIHRLRVEMIERDKREDSEQPSSYN
jgi:uncharacterized small protein (DUF1192 family)